MKRILFILIVSMMLIPCTVVAEDGTNGLKDAQVVIFSGGHPHRLVEVQPEGWYHRESHVLTIEFPSTDFEPYTLTVETLYTTLEYYVTTPLVNQYISPDAVNVYLYIETDAGDLYYGSFEATSNTAME